ncbi:MAG: multiheme c-type cytochrome [Flavobacteriaceae bacterium]
MKQRTIINGFIVLIVVLVSLGVYYYKNMVIESDYYIPMILATHSTSGEHYVGSATCSACHADVYKDHLQTAHYKSSAVADAETIRGRFAEGSNSLDLNDVKYVMEQEGGSFYQHVKIKNRTVVIPPAKFDIVLGSGVRGQTYASWIEDELYQLQASYHTPTDSWINSPGYPDYYLQRPIREACLKCHVTYAESKDFSNQGNEYAKEFMIYGIDCERCHRPAEKHVAYHTNNPQVKTPQFMLAIDSLSRQQRLDVCAQCHSGSRSMVIKGNSFSFLAGESLEEYSRNPSTASDNIPDVHGNQYGLLTSSECFKQTASMDCTTCHNPHQNQRGDIAYFNQKCLGCHGTGFVNCTDDSQEVAKMENNCIGCHMPLTPSTAMKAQLGTDSLETSFNIRTHLIAIYSKNGL